MYFTKKSSGQVTINGFTLDASNDNADIRKSIGVVFQQSLLDERLTVRENILHRGKTYGLSKAQLTDNYQFVSTYLHLEDIEKKNMEHYQGTKRRADIARALIHRPNILFLDEPTTGLDPQTRQFVWQAIKQLQLETNMTVFNDPLYGGSGSRSPSHGLKAGKNCCTGNARCT